MLSVESYSRTRVTKPRTFFIALLIFVLILAGGLLVYAHYFGPVDPYATQQEFIVQEDTPTYQVISELKKQGYIRSQTAFSVALATVTHGANVRPGGYTISASMDALSIANVLGKPPYLVWFTFPPGWRKEQIADRLTTLLNWTPAQREEWLTIDTNKSASYVEGVYYPDTYLIPSDQSPAQVASRLIDRFQQVFAPYASDAAQEGLAWTDVLTMASLIERETGGPQDMALISGILWNRIHTHMALQVDATLQYVVGTEGNWWPTPKPADKAIESPFNTYKHTGLPPHPIAEPSLDSIEAALHPTKTSCLYYLHDTKGQIHCSATYAGQVQNVTKYLKGK